MIRSVLSLTLGVAKTDKYHAHITCFFLFILAIYLQFVSIILMRFYLLLITRDRMFQESD